MKGKGSRERKQVAVEFDGIPPVENGRGFRSKDRRENCCMMRKAAPEIAGLENNLAEQNGRIFDSEERTVKLNNQPALVAPVPSS